MARTAMIKVLLEPGDKKRLEAAAAADRRTVSSYVEGLILADLDAKPKGRK